MKKRLAVLAVCITYLSIFSCMAQHTLLLSNYTFSDNNPVIGKISGKDPASTYTNFKVISPTSIFTVDKNNQLMVRQMPKRTAVPNYEVVIEYQTKAGKMKDTLLVVIDHFKRNQVIAHRGAWKKSGTTENSITALKNAVALGCMGSEFDVHMSADSVLFVHHDHTVGDVDIETTPSAQLAQLKLSNGENLPTVEEYLKEGMKQNRTKLILEIKPSKVSKERSIALTEKVMQLVADLKAQAWVDYISFDYDVCKRVKEIDPYAKVAYLNGDKSPEELAADKLFGLDYNLNVLKKNEQWIKEAQQQNVTTNVWTVNSPSDMQWFLERKVDFITTNEPEKLFELIR